MSALLHSVLAVWVLTATVARAHPLDLGLVGLRVEGAHLRVELRIHTDVAGRLGESPSELMEKTLARGELASGDGLCGWRSPSLTREAQAVVLRATAACPGPVKGLTWHFPWVESGNVPESFEILIRANHGSDNERIHAVRRGQTVARLDVTEGLGLGHFVWMGVEHIGMAPSEWYGEGGWKLPDGIDHILFILALILGGGSLTALVATASGFTLGHSVTLALATLGVVRLPGRLVESAIALSIAFVAVETLLRRDPRHRWKIATAFGLLHGFGFANALTELELSGGLLVKALFGYNLGVELGQVALVCLLAPPLAYLSRVPWWRAVTIPTASTGIFLSGGYWFLQRALGL